MEYFSTEYSAENDFELWNICVFMKRRVLSHVWLFVAPWTVAPQAALVHGIFQARILEWFAVPSSRRSSWPRDGTCVSCVSRRFLTTSATWEAPWADMRKWKPLTHLTLCDPMDYTVRGILQARILEWVAMPSSRGSSKTRDQTQIFHIAGGFLTIWASREAQEYLRR